MKQSIHFCADSSQRFLSGIPHHPRDFDKIPGLLGPALQPKSDQVLFGNSGKEPKKPNRLLPLVLLALVGFGAVSWMNGTNNQVSQDQAVTRLAQSGNDTGFADFARLKDGLVTSKVEDVLELARRGMIRKAYVVKQGSLIEVVLHLNNQQGFKAHFITDNAKDFDVLKAGLQTANPMKPVLVETPPEPSMIGSLLMSMLPMMLFLGVYFFMFRGMMGAGGVTKGLTGGNTAAVGTTPKTRLADVKGCPETVKELEMIVKNIKNFSNNKVGARLPRGILLEGPPGTGKTMMARAVAGEAGVPIFEMKGSEFVEMFVGLGASRVRQLFAAAREKAPCIVFIDEIDAMAKKRGTGMLGGNDERDQTLNQFLAEMDGFNPTENILVIAATNHSENLDPAILRAGRFDWRIDVPAPATAKQRLEILKVHAKNKKLGPDVDLMKVAERTPGATGATLEALLNEGALQAFQHGRELITNNDLLNAADKLTLGLKRSDIVTREEHEKVAKHELGHGLVALANKIKLAMVSMTPRGKTLGHVQLDPTSFSELNPSMEEMLKQITIMMGGRAAEEVFYGKRGITTGASSDLQQAQQRILLMLSTGMFDENYSRNYFQQTMPGQNELSKEHETIMNKVIGEALRTAREMIQTVPPEQFEKMVQLSIEGGDRRGEEAHALFRDTLGKDFPWEKLHQMANAFISDPLGNSRQEAKSA